MTFFTQRGYPLTSLEHDLRRVRTIGRPDALSGSERGDTPVDSVPLVMTYHPFNTYIKRYLLQHLRILSTGQQTRDIFPQPPIVAYKRDLNLRDILVHSTDSSSTEQPGSLACHRPRCQTCQFITPLTDIRGPKKHLHHPRSFHLYFGKSCVLSLLPQMLPSLHRRNWAKSQESHW